MCQIILGLGSEKGLSRLAFDPGMMLTLKGERSPLVHVQGSSIGVPAQCFSNIHTVPSILYFHITFDYKTRGQGYDSSVPLGTEVSGNVLHDRMQ